MQAQTADELDADQAQGFEAVGIGVIPVSEGEGVGVDGQVDGGRGLLALGNQAFTGAMKITIQLLVLLLTVAGCSRRMPPPSHSPSGTFTLVPSTPQKHADPAYGCLVIEIRDATGKVLCHTNTGVRAFGWTMYWSSDNQVVIDSPETGTQHWNGQADGSWKKQ